MSKLTKIFLISIYKMKIGRIKHRKPKISSSLLLVVEYNVVNRTYSLLEGRDGFTCWIGENEPILGKKYEKTCLLMSTLSFFPPKITKKVCYGGSLEVKLQSLKIKPKLSKLLHTGCPTKHDSSEKAWRSSSILEIICGIHLSTFFNVFGSRNNNHKISLILVFRKCGLPFLSFHLNRKY